MTRSSFLLALCLAALAPSALTAATESIRVGQPEVAITESSRSPGGGYVLELVTAVPWPASVKITELDAPGGVEIQSVLAAAAVNAPTKSGEQRRQRHTVKFTTAKSGTYVVKFAVTLDPAQQGGTAYSVADGTEKSVRLAVNF